MRLMSGVAKILPPLSNQDITRLALLLPTLAASLENGNLPSQEEMKAPEFAFDVRGDLVSYALNSDYDEVSRSAAAACLHSSILHLANSDSQDCPAKHLLQDSVMGTLLEAAKDLNESSTLTKTSTVKVVDCFNLCSIVVSLALLSREES